MQKEIEEKNLKDYLFEFSGKEVDFYRFPGNYGDSLIYHGTKILLDELKININLVDMVTEAKNEILLIDGGGNFVKEYSDVYNFLHKKHSNYKRIIILPHTINGEKSKEIIEKFDSNVTIFCREIMSYLFVKNSSTKAGIYLWHDCAFYNDFRKYQKRGTGVLNAFRIDIESLRKELPKNNADISYNGWAMKPLDEFISKIQDFEEIRTDRLHVAIAGALLGKKVLMFSNSYYKNNAVYEYSLKKFPKVIFVCNKQQSDKHKS